MTSLSTAQETILQSDRVPVFIGTNRLFLKKGVQSTNRTVEIPNTVLGEQGNSENRGIAIQAPRVSFTLEDLSVDMDMEQLLSEQYSSISSNAFTGASSNGYRKLNSYRASGSGIIAYIVGPTDKINNVIISFSSAAGIRVGEGGRLSSIVGSNVVKLLSSAKATNFSLGDSVLIQQDCKASANTSLATISRISGNIVTIAGYSISGLSAAKTYMFVNDGTNVAKGDFVSGVPAVMKGIEFFAHKRKPTVTFTTGSAVIAEMGVTDISTIQSNDWRDSIVDVLMLYNDYSDALIYSRYVQDAGCTSVAFNYSADGNAVQSYNFTTGKSMDYAGYVLRRSGVVSAAGVTINLNQVKSYFRGSEAVDPVGNNTTFNDSATSGKNFLKLTTIDKVGVKKIWKEVASGTSSLNSDEYKLSGTTLTFGTSVTSASRIEATFLCKAANLYSTNEYKFDTTAFSHTGTPDAVTGKYQPLTINSSNFDNRVDGVESSTFTVAFTRDYFNAQGVLSTRIKPASKGSIDGSFTTREGFSKTMRVITDGTYSTLTDGTQIDASKASVYTNSNTVPLRIRLYDPSDNTTIIKTITIDSIQVTNVTNGNSTGGDSTFNVNFMGKKGKLSVVR